MKDGAIEVLFFGAHPDDLELSCGGLIIQMCRQGRSVGMIDLTKGEKGTYGTVAIRHEESMEAAEILGVKFREILDMGDCRLENNQPNQLAVAALIRKYRPRLIVVPTTFDRHPDHAAAGQILSRAFFSARIQNIKLDFPAHSPDLLMRYFLHDYSQASFIVDITDVFEKKMTAMKAYRSQMSERVVPVGYQPIGIKNYLEDIEARARYYGSLIQVTYGEPYLLDRPPPLKDPFVLINREETSW